MATSLDSDVTSLRVPQKFKRVHCQPENPFFSLVSEQTVAIIPEFTLESGVTLRNVPLSYKTWGELSPNKDNVMVICHAFTGSPDIGDWWGPLLGGPGRALDTTKFFIICMNSLGSPYGSASPVTCKDGDPKNEIYGPEFPLTTIRDDVTFHKMLLEELGVRKIEAVIGGSMGGMLVLEWAYFGKDYVQCIVAIATSSRHSAWGISWGEAQRQSIYADPKYNDGYYTFEDPPSTGLGAARMSALLTYRSRDSFEARFSRSTPNVSTKLTTSQDSRPPSAGEIHLAIHNDGHLSKRRPNRQNSPPIAFSEQKTSSATIKPDCSSASDSSCTLSSETEEKKNALTHFSAQTYLRYKGSQFVKRFDSNCYIAISRKLDTHDLSRCRTDTIKEALALIEQPTLVIGIESDGLFTFSEQTELSSSIPNARLERIDSSEGHDAFLLQFEQVNAHILRFLSETISDRMEPKTEIGHVPIGSLAEGRLSLVAQMDDITNW